MTGLFKTLPLALVLVLAVSACKSSEEKAEEFYQSGLALSESGDYDRAIVELRNVFELNGSHRDARFLLANIMMEQKNDARGAYGQFLRLAEQYPDDLETRIILSEIAFDVGNWEEFDRHAERAIALDPEQPRVRAIAIAKTYRAAELDGNASASREQSRAAQDLLTELPESLMLRKITLDTMVRDGRYAEALTAIDWLLERDPNNTLYWRQRLSLLVQTGDMEAIQALLQDMVARFPDDIEYKQSLLRFYVGRGQTDEAEAFLREQMAQADPGDSAPRIDLINFLLQIRGNEAAMVELETAIAEAADPLPFQVIRAGIRFTEGQQTEAVAEMEAVLKDAEPTEQTRNITVALARMLMSMGNEVGARARVEEVLTADASHPEALKMQAAWQIRADETDAAINGLRLVLDRAPDDVQAMALMSEAYSRSGRPELAQEFLALAVDASGNAPEQSLTYARVLIDKETYLPAEDILIRALRLQPRNVQLLSMLGELYLRMEDLGRADQVVATLRDIEDPAAQEAATGLEAQLINTRNGVGEALSYLEGLATGDDATLNNQLQLIRARLATGDGPGALDLSRKLQEENPENQVVKAISASVEAANGNLDTAITAYREIVTAEPRASNAWLELARVIQRRDGAEAASAVVSEALAAVPEDPNLLWANASYLELAGDIDGAITIYEGLYERNSGSVVVANNLASLLSTYRTDEASLERAWTVARRFRDTEIPAMQDTFGWILHRRGESNEALPYLEAAAQGLPNDPVVQYHLGKAYQTLERPDDALAQFRKAAQIAPEDDQRAQIVDARAQIAAAESGAQTGATTGAAEN